MISQKLFDENKNTVGLIHLATYLSKIKLLIPTRDIHNPYVTPVIPYRVA